VLDHRRYLRFVGDVGPDPHGVGAVLSFADRGCGVFRDVLVEVVDDDVGAVGREFERRRAAVAAAAA
jgi:hypothetical protein